MDYEDFGKRLRRAGTKKGLTQEVLAEKAEISPSYLSDIERGIKSPGFGTFIELVKILDVSADYILQGFLDSGEVYVYNDINRKLDKLKPKQRQFISDFIDEYIKSLELG